jgi:hypothetical protein
MVAAEGVLRDAYQLCSDSYPERKMTEERANILNEFYTGASGRADGFQYFKNPSTLTKYFTAIKQLLCTTTGWSIKKMATLLGPSQTRCCRVV